MPAWRNKPSWYLIAENDKAVPPELQREMAGRMGAAATAVESAHFPMLSQPQKVLDVIREAANGC